MATIHAEIDNWLDANLKRRVQRAFVEAWMPLKRIEQEICGEHAEQIEELSERLDDIKTKLAEWAEEASDLWQDIAADMEQQKPDLSDVELPRSLAPGETDRFVLFDSRRDYFTQMDAYNAWRDGDEPTRS